uniref:Peptidase A1 domain-containing protein n=1 Tax=Leersia perrieri TaxID=77586 RepID=A0A0D9V452_9ORYZ
MAGRRRVVLLLVVVAAAFLVAATSAGRATRGKSARFELLRLAPAASLPDLARMDRERMAFISSRRASARRRAEETASAFAMPLSSGAYTGTGQYFVRFRVGTPAQPFLLVADTGSDLTWVKCHRAAAASKNASSYSHPAAAASPRRTFHPDKSRTWAPISCSSATCKESLPFSLAACSTPANPCAYDYRYKDGSAARGTVGTDSATIALASGRAAPAPRNKAKLSGVVLGCTTAYNGESFLASDGVLSLGYSNVSFASHAASRFGGRFSYCLVDHLAPRNATSYLTFGPNPAFSSPPPLESTASCKPAPAPAPADAHGARQTPLVLDHRTRPFYAVTVRGVSVAGELLKIPRAVWDVDQGGGAILDSGTSLTVLARPAYRAVVAALSKRLAGVPRVAMDPFDYCYNWTSPSTGGDLDVALPMLAVHFAGSARLEPPAKSYVIDAAPGVKCIGLQEAPWPGLSVIGNILQQEHLWEYDLKNRRLRFKRSRCTH